MARSECIFAPRPDPCPRKDFAVPCPGRRQRKKSAMERSSSVLGIRTIMTYHAISEACGPVRPNPCRRGGPMKSGTAPSIRIVVRVRSNIFSRTMLPYPDLSGPPCCIVGRLGTFRPANREIGPPSRETKERIPVSAALSGKQRAGSLRQRHTLCKTPMVYRWTAGFVSSTDGCVDAVSCPVPTASATEAKPSPRSRAASPDLICLTSAGPAKTSAV